MASQTSFLRLTKPERGEFTDRWDIPMNDNSDIVDDYAKQVDDELSDARGSQATLGDRLDQSLDAEGNVVNYPEVEDARVSPTNGTFSELKERLDVTDWEIWDAREFSEDLRSALADREVLVESMIIDGGKNANGEPTWAGFTNDRVDISATPDPVDLMIDGYRSRIRSDTSVTLSGGAGTYYIIAKLAKDGVVIVDGDSTDGDPVDPEGTTSADTNGDFTVFSDSTRDFVGLGVQVGDKLQLLDSQDEGEYVIDEIAYDGNNDQVRIKGVFPVGGIASINYNILDPWGVELSSDTSDTSASDELTICEAEFDGSAVTDVTARHFKDTYVGDWRTIDVDATPQFTESWIHALGSDKVSVTVQVSQANDGSEPVEELTLAQLTNSLTLDVNNGDLAVNNTIEDNDGIFNAGSSGATVVDWGRIFGDVVLEGDVAGSLTGDVSPANSVIMRYTRNRIDVKNTISGAFYRDWDGTTQTTGFLRVIVRRRG